MKLKLTGKQLRVMVLEKAQQLEDELPLLYQNAQLQEEPDVDRIKMSY